MTTHRLGLAEVRSGGSPVLPEGHHIIYGVTEGGLVDGVALGANEARLKSGPCQLETAGEAHLLVWTLTERSAPAPEGVTLLQAPVTLDPEQDYLLRCDRVDFPAGGVAFLHTHQGPGIRCLIHGSFRVETEGRILEIPRYGAWFEGGPDPVYAEGDRQEPSAFVRVMVLPRALLQQSSIRYVREEDKAKPKSQSYTVFVDAPIDP